jgi:hypothetical protein
MTEELIQEHFYTSEDKIKWFGYGEWVEEPDKISFTYKAYDCVVLRTCLREPCEIEAIFGGHLNGYVKIPENNSNYAKEYYDIHVDCHYGLTFSAFDEEGDFWIGFDCAHSGDYVPSIELFKKRNQEMIESRKHMPIPDGYKHHWLFHPTYKNVQYCTNECKNIVDQLVKKKEVV